MAPVISLNDIGVRYANSDDWTLQGVSLQIRAREFVSLVGGSGVGKSTLLRVIGGLLPQQSGSIDMPVSVRAGQRQHALVFQDGRLLPWRTVRGNIAFGMEGLRLDAASRAMRIDEVLALTRLERFADRWPHELSGGQMQRVGIARALAVKPSILLMDEPFSAVDALTRQTLQEELLRLWEQTDAAVVFVTHDIDEALLLSDRVVVLGGQPAGIVLEATMTSPRPRETHAEEFQRESGRILDALGARRS